MRGGSVARPGAVLLCAAVAAVCVTGKARGGDNFHDFRVDDRNFITGFVLARWDARALPVAWRIHDDGVINNANQGNTTVVSVVQAAALLEQGFQAWTDVPASRVAAVFDRDCLLTGLDPAIQCSEGRTSTGVTGVDGENILTWSEPSIAGGGPVARTVTTALTADLLVGPSTRDVNGDGQIDLSPVLYPDGITLAAGTIVDADIGFNPVDLDWVTTPSAAGRLADILGVALHEQGHWFGFAHSHLLAPLPTMFPFIDLLSIDRQLEMRRLWDDDKASAKRFYPEEPATSNSTGSVVGRLVDGGGNPVVGEPVSAVDTSTLQAMASDFTAHPLNEASPGAGAFALEGLPPGEYFLRVGTFDASVPYLDRARYSADTAYGDSAGQRPAFAVDPALESTTDDFLPARRFTVPPLAQGGPVDAGTIIVNTGTPAVAPLGAATPLGFGDEEAKLVDFPAGFTFPFYGIEYRRMFVYDNGYVTFTNAASPAPDSIPQVTQRFERETLGDFLSRSPKAGVLYRNHDASVDNRGQSTGIIDVHLQTAADRVSLTWAAVPEVVLSSSLTAQAVRADTFTLSLFSSGLIEMRYGSVDTGSGIVGITPGGAGVTSRVVDLSEAGQVRAGPLEAIVEEFWVGKIDFTAGTRRIFDGFDLGGGVLRFIPGADFAYTVTQAGLKPGEVSAPGSAVALTAGGVAPTLLSWEPAAPLFNLYRGLVSVLRASGLYTPDGAACLASGLPGAGYSDGDVPPAGDAFHYLVSGENSTGAEGTLGTDSAGAERANTSPCP